MFKHKIKEYFLPWQQLMHFFQILVFSNILLYISLPILFKNHNGNNELECISCMILATN